MAEIASTGADKGEHRTYSNHIYAPTSKPGSQAYAQPGPYYESATSPSTSTHLSSNAASQSSTLEYSGQTETPPSAISNPSSQEQPSRSTQKVAQESYERGTVSVRRLESYPRNQPPPLDTNVPRISVAHNNELDGEYVHGHKRTASGDIKSGGASLPTSPVNTTPRRHAKTASISSNGSQIGELSAQLRTRLSYAMVKVQHGWQTRTISEIESLAASPISTTTTTSTRPFDSPLPTPTTTYPTFAQSSERSTATPEYIHTATAPGTTSSLDYAYPSHHHHPSSPVYSPDHHHHHHSRTYEQFWRDHSSSSASRNQHLTTGPSLAPAVDIQPRRSNYPSHAQTQYPSLSSLHTTLNSSSTGSPGTAGPMPSTPTKEKRAPGSSSAIRTPSQNKKAEMEKDAVEGLLFMSSPGNSVLRGRGSGHRRYDKRVGLEGGGLVRGDGFSSDEEASGVVAGRGGGGVGVGVGVGVGRLPVPQRVGMGMGMGVGLAVRGGGVRVGLLGKGDEIDRLLDGMVASEGKGENSSSSDDDDDGDGDGHLPLSVSSVPRTGLVRRGLL